MAFRGKIDSLETEDKGENGLLLSLLKMLKKKVTERLLVLSNTDSGGAKSITDMILVEITKAGLTLSRIFSQVYDSVSVMAGNCGGVQRQKQDRENRETP